MKKLCMLHTSDGFVDMMSNPFTKPFIQDNPDIEYFDIADSSLIAETKKAGYATPEVARRMYAYMMAAVDAGADGILVTCTSVNTVTKKIRDIIPIPVVSIEEPVAKIAVEKGRKIGILSSVATSAVPVKTTIEECAAAEGKKVEAEIEVADGAFEALLAGDRPLHDEKVRAALDKLAKRVDVVVFAQFSMALVEHRDYGIPVLKFGRLSYDAIKEAMYAAEKKE